MRSLKILPFIILAFGFFSLGIASLLLLSPNLQTNGQHTSDASMDCVEPAKVNSAAPAIKLTDLGKDEVEIADFLGEVVLLNTWATWCPPCQAEMPDLQAFYEKYKEQGFTLIGVNIGESNEQVLSFALENQLTFPLWLDPNEQSLRALNTISLPYSIVIDRDGIVRFAWSGATCIDALEKSVAPMILQ
jgi:cytochrome c biogenesis protein CcmG/thiol:disulfide interchange protein DsbE